MEHAYAFVAGFISTLTFHQGTLFVLHKAGLWPKPPYPMTATKPLNIPAVISLALWGGVWGIFAWYLIRDVTGVNYWLYATLFGAIAPSIVALFVVFPAKGMPLAGGWNPKVIIPVLILNGAWGLGVAVLMRVAG
jgi:FtsH-binding integral membrane protein